MDIRCTINGEKTPAEQGMITVLFEKEQKSVRPALLNLKNEYQEIINTSFNAQIGGELGLEIVLVRGDSARIKSFEQQIVAKRGIRSVKLMLIPS